jgi:hypothetical protein
MPTTAFQIFSIRIESESMAARISSVIARHHNCSRLKRMSCRLKCSVDLTQAGGRRRYFLITRCLEVGMRVTLTEDRWSWRAGQAEKSLRAPPIIE